MPINAIINFTGNLDFGTGLGIVNIEPTPKFLAGNFLINYNDFYKSSSFSASCCIS